MNDGRSWGLKLSGILMSLVLLAACGQDAAQPNSSGRDQAGAGGNGDSTGTAGPTETVVASENIEVPGKTGYKDSYYEVEWSANDSTMIALGGSSAQISGSGAAFADGTLTITEGGTYVLSGTLNDGQVVVDVTRDTKVNLILNGVEITNDDQAAIYIKEADRVTMTLQEGTENFISDGAEYRFPDGSDEPTAAIYSKADLVINGTGALTVQGNYNDGLVSRDDLIIISGQYAITAADDAIIGRDLLAVQGGTFRIQAGGDALKSTNDKEADKGHIMIEGGTFELTAGSDGMQSAASIRIDGGSFHILAGGGSANGEVKSEPNFRGGRGGSSARSSPEDTPSTKGIKARSNLLITGGSFVVDAADDALHSNGNIVIRDGDFTLLTGDDGIHADASVTIEGGRIAIAKSYEGIEGAAVTILGGEIDIQADDDGINIAGGNDGLSMGRPRSQDNFASAGPYLLSIQGGRITVTAEGDGLDSNGSIEMSGGTVLVNGPTMSMNGALDYDGSFRISGGVLIAAGNASMAAAPSSDSSQHSVAFTYSSMQKAGTKFALKDASGQVVLEAAPTKAYQSIVLSSPDLASGATYSVYTDDTKLYEFEVQDAVTWLNESGVTTGRSGGGFGGGFGGGRGGRVGGGF